LTQALTVLHGRIAKDVVTLLEADGPDFVRTAYLTLLGRKPDVSGRESAEDFLRRGGRKIDLVWSLVQSEEGRQLEIALPGLASALRHRALGRLPIAGVLIRSLFRMEPLGTTHRLERAIAFATAKSYETLLIRLHRLTNDVEVRLRTTHFGGGFGGLPDADHPSLRSQEIMKSLQVRLSNAHHR
jgi:hypothetical protein